VGADPGWRNPQFRHGGEAIEVGQSVEAFSAKLTIRRYKEEQTQ